MKKNKTSKLSLRASTIRQLDLSHVQGGRADTEYPTCGGSVVCAEPLLKERATR